MAYRRAGSVYRVLQTVPVIPRKIAMETDIERLRREMREHPERFDFADLPPGQLTAAQKRQAEESSPDWLKDMIARQQGR